MRVLRVVLTLCLLSAPATGVADDDHDRARRALEAGEVRPLATIVALVEAEVGGRVVEAELEREDERWVYELKLVTADGRMVEAEVDAATGDVLKIERRRR